MTEFKLEIQMDIELRMFMNVIINEYKKEFKKFGRDISKIPTIFFNFDKFEIETQLIKLTLKFKYFFTYTVMTRESITFTSLFVINILQDKLLF